MRSKYALAALMTAASLLLFGYDFGVDPNLAQVLPFINKLMNPGLYPGDAFLNSFSSFPSLYPRAAAVLGRFVPLAPAHLAGYLAIRFFFLLLVFELAENLTGSRKAAFAALCLAAVSAQTSVLTPLGEDPLLKTAFYQSSLCGLAGVLSLLLFFRKKYLPAFAALGAMLFINGLPAIFLAALLAAALPGSPDAAGMRRGWALFGVIALGWLIWVLGLPNLSGGPGREYTAMLKHWYPGHYFPSGWDRTKWLRIAEFVPLNLFFIRSGAAGSPERRALRAFMAAFLGMWAAAFIFGELLPVPSLINLQFFRSDAFFCLLGTIFAADFLRRLYEESEPGAWALGALIVLAFMETGPAFYPFFVLALAVSRRRAPGWAFRAAALAGAAFCAWQSLASAPADKKLVVALTLFALAALAGDSYKTSFRPFAGALFALAAAAVPYLPLVNYRLANRSLSNYGEDAVNWVELQKWAGANTPSDARFLVPPDTYGFRVFSLRSPVVEWLDCSAMHWAPGFEKEWGRKIADLRSAAPEPEGPDLGYSGINAAGFKELGRKYGAAYVVRRGGAPLPLAVLHSNPGFTLYSLP